MHHALAATVVDWDSLLQASAGGLLAGVGLVVAFSTLLYGLIHGYEHRRAGHVAHAAIDYLLAAASLLALTALLTLGLAIILGG